VRKASDIHDLKNLIKKKQGHALIIAKIEKPEALEANDMANAVLDGADALMLSGETSVGKYPVETITSMQSIIVYNEIHGSTNMMKVSFI